MITKFLAIKKNLIKVFLYLTDSSCSSFCFVSKSTIIYIEYECEIELLKLQKEEFIKRYQVNFELLKGNYSYYYGKYIGLNFITCYLKKKQQNYRKVNITSKIS